MADDAAILQIARFLVYTLNNNRYLHKAQWYFLFSHNSYSYNILECGKKAIVFLLLLKPFSRGIAGNFSEPFYLVC